MGHSPLTLDVRPTLVAGQDPFGAVMQAICQLGVDQELLLIAPFEPTPLYALLEQQGITHYAEHTASNEWHITLRRAAVSAPAPGQNTRQPMSSAGERASGASESAGTRWQPARERSERECGNRVPARAAPRSGPQVPAAVGAAAAPEGSASAAQQTIQLDTRGMEPPGPLVRILTTLETLDDRQSLVAHIDREPLLLFPELLNRGWAYEGAPQADSSFIIAIHRPR